MRFGFVSCVQLGKACVEEIMSFGGHLELLVTLTDDRGADKAGRAYFDELANEFGIPLHKVGNINDRDALRVLKSADLDWLFVVGWSQIAAPDVLASARLGALGIHPTLLPEGRGRASIPWAILKGLGQTGVTLFCLDAGVDTGPILMQEVLPLARDESATSLYARVTEAHRTLVRRIWPELQLGMPQSHEQDESRATTWPGRRPEDGEIVETMTVAEVERLVRAVTHPYPGAFRRWPDGSCLRIWSGEPLTGDAPPDALVLSLADGGYVIHSYSWSR